MSAPDQPTVADLRRRVPFTGLAETHLEELRRRGRLRRLDQGRILFKRGEKAPYLHFLLEGSVDLADAQYRVTAVRAGSEAALAPLDDRAEHAVTAVSTSPVAVFVIDKDDVDLVLTWDEAGNYVVDELGADARVSAERDWMSSLLASPLFATVPPANIQQLFLRFEEKRVKAGDVVIRQGEPGDYFYVVKSGRCRVSRHREAGGEVELAVLGSGDIFGEEALIGDAPRNATITMLAGGVLMRLDQESFQDLLQKPVIDHLDWAAVRRLAAESATRVEILDVRLPREFEEGSPPGSRNLPLQVLRQNFRRLDPDALYVVACDGGRRSELAAFLLNQQGFDARVLAHPPRG